MFDLKFSFNKRNKKKKQKIMWEKKEKVVEESRRRGRDFVGNPGKKTPAMRISIPTAAPAHFRHGKSGFRKYQAKSTGLIYILVF